MGDTTSNPILERAKAHFAEVSSNRRHLEVDEWDCTIYTKPLTLAQRQKCYALAKGEQLVAFAHAIIMKAENEDGERIFSIKDLPAFKGQIDSEVTLRVGTWIMDSQSIGDEELGE